MSLLRILFAAMICCTFSWAAKPSQFRAAVFESPPAMATLGMTPRDIMVANLKLIEIAAEEAAKRGADIFVASEYSVMPPGPKAETKHFAETVPDPQKVSVNPCAAKSAKGFTDVLSSFSCMAKKHNMYVVGTLLDMHPCSSSQTCDAKNPNCESTDDCGEGNVMYNTAVAFDRSGNLIARYHKNRLYFELLDTPKVPEMVTFETDFGKLGVFSCFDSNFEYAARLARDYGVDTIVFPTHWYDDLVPFTAVEWQQSWAIANKVNFLAADKHIPGSATFGSGIYTKDFGALAYTYNPDGKAKLVISNVPRDGTPIDFDAKVLIIEENQISEIEEEGKNFLEHCHVTLKGPPRHMHRDHRCYKIQTKKHTLKKLEKPSGSLEVCNNNFCCSLKYEAESMKEDYYLTAFSGINDVRGYFKWMEQTCLLVRCDPIEDIPCAAFPSKATTVFKSAELKAKFKSDFVYPTVSKSSHRLAPKSEWTFKEDKYSVLTYNSQTSEPLLKIGLFSRNYAEDPVVAPHYKTFRSNPFKFSMNV